MNAFPAVVGCAVLLAVGCGDEDSESAEPAQPAPAAVPAPAPAAKGTKIVVRDSDFGRMLWGANRQAIYIFENDKRNKSRCYGECAELWPPVHTKGAPRAGAGVKKGLLGTIERRNGRKQVTYKGQPLYYYAHEGPDEVLCHNVFLNGGLWWVVGPDGRRRP